MKTPITITFYLIKERHSRPLSTKKMYLLHNYLPKTFFFFLVGIHIT